MHEPICKWTNFSLYTIRFVTTISKLYLPKCKGAKGGQLGPKDPVNAPIANRLRKWPIFSTSLLEVLKNLFVSQLTKSVRGKGRSAALEVYDDVIGPLGFIAID